MCFMGKLLKTKVKHSKMCYHLHVYTIYVQKAKGTLVLNLINIAAPNHQNISVQSNKLIL